jgi:hypothetical protein
MTTGDDWPNELRGLSHRVLQAAEMVAAQGGCDVKEALGRLKIRADVEMWFASAR